MAWDSPIKSRQPGRAWSPRCRAKDGVRDLEFGRTYN